MCCILRNTTLQGAADMSDIETIRRAHSLVEVVRRAGIELASDGDEWVGLCPFHPERTPSFTVFAGRQGIERFQCFGCGQAGDVIDFTAKIKGVSTGEAIRMLRGETQAGADFAPIRAEAADHYAGILRLSPIGEIASNKKIVLYNPKRERNGNITPSAVHPYRHADGSLLGYVLRHDLPDGSKETPMVCWVRLPDGRECWARMPFARPRPLYGLDRIGPAGQVVVVEGEKCADALWKFWGKPVVSWPGGTQGAKHCDWSPLAGRGVAIWPDADAPGLAVAHEIADRLADLGCAVKVMDILGDNFA
jgi:CHC2 zinc finger